MFRTLSDIYDGCQGSVNVNGVLTEWFEIKFGVHQGDNISPVCFNVFINDLALEIKNYMKGINYNGVRIDILMYADDMVLFL